MATTMPLGSTPPLCDATSCDGDHLAVRLKNVMNNVYVVCRVRRSSNGDHHASGIDHLVQRNTWGRRSSCGTNENAVNNVCVVCAVGRSSNGGQHASGIDHSMRRNILRYRSSGGTNGNVVNDVCVV